MRTEGLLRTGVLPAEGLGQHVNTAPFFDPPAASDPVLARSHPTGRRWDSVSPLHNWQGHVSGSGFGKNLNIENPEDYVWEYVTKCTAETQPCDPNQVNAFYLRTCPRGTQLVNATIGSYNFDLISQQCVPCGPLNYIVDPGSGGTCQECPKGERGRGVYWINVGSMFLLPFFIVLRL